MVSVPFATVMKSLDIYDIVSFRGFLNEVFKKEDPDSSSFRLMRGEITFSQVRDTLEKAFSACMPISHTDHAFMRAELCLLYPFTPMGWKPRDTQRDILGWVIDFGAKQRSIPQ